MDGGPQLPRQSGRRPWQRTCAHQPDRGGPGPFPLADVGPLRHYDLRHTTASLLIDQGAELRDVMEQLGHSQIALTANMYGHIFSDRKKKLAQAMGDLLAPQETAVAARVN